jgi:hypothetical protein
MKIQACLGTFVVLVFICTCIVQLFYESFWSTIRALRRQLENPVFVDDEAVGIALDHPKLEWISVRLVESLLFKVEDWCKNPGATYARACDSVFRVKKLV